MVEPLHVECINPNGFSPGSIPGRERNCENMITEFSKRTGVPIEDLLSSSRLHRIAEARELYWYILLLNGFRITEIARLNEREHGTVISGVRRIKGLLEARDITVTRMYNLTKNIKRQ
jgi:chromosomal replication initiation ATPase DnaA